MHIAVLVQRYRLSPHFHVLIHIIKQSRVQWQPLFPQNFWPQISIIFYDCIPQKKGSFSVRKPVYDLIVHYGVFIPVKSDLVLF